MRLADLAGRLLRYVPAVLLVLFQLAPRVRRPLISRLPATGAPASSRQMSSPAASTRPTALPPCSDSAPRSRPLPARRSQAPSSSRQAAPTGAAPRPEAPPALTAGWSCAASPTSTGCRPRAASRCAWGFTFPSCRASFPGTASAPYSARRWRAFPSLHTACRQGPGFRPCLLLGTPLQRRLCLRVHRWARHRKSGVSTVWTASPSCFLSAGVAGSSSPTPCTPSSASTV